MSRVLGLVMIALVATGCGGNATDTTDAPPAAARASATSSEARSSGPSDAASDLSDFVCEPVQGGEWTASGVITNSTGHSADYRVTVVVADRASGSVGGKSRTLTDLVPGSPESFRLEGLPANGAADPTCHVEVLRLP